MQTSTLPVQYSENDEAVENQESSIFLGKTASRGNVDARKASPTVAASSKYSPAVDVKGTSVDCIACHFVRTESPPSVQIVSKAVSSSCTVDEAELKKIIDGFEIDYRPIPANVSPKDASSDENCSEPSEDLEILLQCVQVDLRSDIRSDLVKLEAYVTNLPPEQYSAAFNLRSSCADLQTEFDDEVREKPMEKTGVAVTRTTVEQAFANSSKPVFPLQLNGTLARSLNRMRVRRQRSASEPALQCTVNSACFVFRKRRTPFQESDEEQVVEGGVEYIGTIAKISSKMQLYHEASITPSLSGCDESEEPLPRKNRMVDNNHLRNRPPPIYSGLTDQTTIFAFELMYGGCTKFSDEAVESFSSKGIIYQRLWRAALVMKPLVVWTKNSERVTISQYEEIVRCCPPGTKLFCALWKFINYMTSNAHIIRPALEFADKPLCFDLLPTAFARVFDSIFEEIRADFDYRRLQPNRRAQTSSTGLAQCPRASSLHEIFHSHASVSSSDAIDYEQRMHDNPSETNSSLQFERRCGQN